MTTNTSTSPLELVRAIWCEVLGLDEVGDDTNFYAVGGDSLTLVAVVERLRQSTGRAVRVIDALHAGTVGGHADLLTEATP